MGTSTSATTQTTEQASRALCRWVREASESKEVKWNGLLFVQQVKLQKVDVLTRRVTLYLVMPSFSFGLVMTTVTNISEGNMH